MKPQTFKGTITNIEKLTHNVKVFTVTLQSETGVDFFAGQYMIIKMPSPTPLFRSYSIFSSPASKKELKFLVEIVPGGRASAYFDVFEVGQELEMRGPFGFFVLQDSPAGHVFIATGTGIAPLFSMITHLYAKDPNASSEIYFGVRAEKDICLHEELQTFSKYCPQYKYTLTLSRPNETWTGAQGRVTEHLHNQNLDPRKKYYLCGSTDMINDVAALLTTKGIPRENILFERFY